MAQANSFIVSLYNSLLSILDITLFSLVPPENNPFYHRIV